MRMDNIGNMSKCGVNYRQEESMTSGGSRRKTQ